MLPEIPQESQAKRKPREPLRGSKRRNPPASDVSDFYFALVLDVM
jgi:hypothetical protein